MKKITIVLSVLFISGCAAKWHKSGSTTTEFYSDRSQCNVMAYRTVPEPVSDKNNPMAGFYASMTRQGMYKDCMRGKGWTTK